MTYKDQIEKDISTLAKRIGLTYPFMLNQIYFVIRYSTLTEQTKILEGLIAEAENANTKQK